MTGKVLIWLVVLGAAVFVFSRFVPPTSQVQAMEYSTFLNELQAGRVDSVTLKGETIAGSTKDKTQFRVYNPETENTELITALRKANVRFKGEPPDQPNFLAQLLLQLAG